jgi:hypothetical protein
MPRPIQFLALASIALVGSTVNASAPDSIRSLVRSPRNDNIIDIHNKNLAFYRRPLDNDAAAAVVVVPHGGAVAKKSTITITQKTAVMVGFVLAFNSGYMNGICLNGFFQGTKQAVAAMTGSYTNSALWLAGGSTGAFYAQMRVLGGYILGNVIASYLNPTPVLWEIGPSVGPALLLAGAALVAASSKPLQDSQWLFALCAMANGIQNSITSVHTGNLSRTSHYTGISSDMGTFLGQCLGGNTANLMKLKVFFGLACCFWTGSYLSFFKAKDTGLWANVAVYAVLGGSATLASWKQQQLVVKKA